MSKFPESVHADAASYCSGYLAALADAARAIDTSKVEAAAATILRTVNAGGTIFSCGNGGSAAIADHLICDFVKGVRTDTHLHPRVVSLVSTVSLITAISNDINYESVFRYQLESLAKPGDLVVAVSSSGNSENIIQALQWAKDNHVASVALTGFSGGRAKPLADVAIHVPADNYGVVEDLHQSLMHILAQYLRQAHVPADAFGRVQF